MRVLIFRTDAETAKMIWEISVDGEWDEQTCAFYLSRKYKNIWKVALNLLQVEKTQTASAAIIINEEASAKCLPQFENVLDQVIMHEFGHFFGDEYLNGDISETTANQVALIMARSKNLPHKVLKMALERGEG